MKSIIAFCRSKSVPLIVVNMPLTERNLKILPANFLALYEKTITDICSTAARDGSLAFINLRHSDHFVLSDFRDTAHMRSTGGKKLADILAPIVIGKLTAEGTRVAGKANARVAAKSGGFN